MPTGPRVFVINMAGDADRRLVMQSRADQAGLEIEFFDAVDGRALSPDQIQAYDSKKRRKYFGRDLLPAEIGCLLSHRGIYEKMVKDCIPVAGVLEDDVAFEPDVKQVFSSLLQTPVRWDVIRFLGSEKIYRRGCRLIRPLTGRYSLARLPTTPGGAHGYMIRLDAARVMLAHMQKNWLPIDALQGRCWRTGLETLIVHPAPLYPDEAQASTIGDLRFDKNLKLGQWQKCLYPFNRAVFKLEEALGKKFIYLSSWFRDRLVKHV